MYLLPAVSALILSLSEKVFLKRTLATSKTVPIIWVALLNILTSLALAMTLIVPFVMLVKPFQVCSIEDLGIGLPEKLILSMLLIDFLNYITHRLHHKVPMLWRFHRLHHSDIHVNAQTSLLNHPFELVSSSMIMIFAAILLGIPPVSFVFFGLIMGVHSAFVHSEFTLPVRVEEFLRWLIVTPTYHRKHHVKDFRTSNVNFGQVFIYWDVLFGTFLLRKDKSPEVHGISSSETPKSNTIWHFLINPSR